MVQAYGLATPLPCWRPDGGHWQGCPSAKLTNVYQCQHTYHDPQAGWVFCHGGCLTGICLSLTVMVIVVIDCFVLLRSPSRSEK